MPEARLALVVDDDVTNREAMSELLEDLGYRVRAAENGQRALELSKQQPPPDLILLDLVMPVMTGWQFLEERKKDGALSAVPVIVVSATLGAAAQLQNVAGYLMKPVTAEAILAVLDRASRGAPAPEQTLFAVAPQKTSLSVLFVEERDADAKTTMELLERSRDFQLQVERARGLAEALQRLDAQPADVVLVDLKLSIDGGSVALKKLIRRSRPVPVVAILEGDMPHGRADALRLGAQDALHRDAQTPEVLGRALHHAFERFRLKVELERAGELAAHEREKARLTLLAQSRSTVSSEMLGHRPLRLSAPGLFAAFVRDFVATCEAAIAEREHEVQPSSQRGELQKLADGLASVRAGPGDIVDVYQEALSRAFSAESSELGMAKREEARLMLIGLLGYVLAAYRLYAVPE